MSALSLNWDGKESAICAADEVERQILDFDESLSYGDNSDNLIVQADNLAALKSLLPFYRGQVKCVYIDPPYNTGSAFPNYKDNFPHSEWLNMMYPRLQLLREFLSDDGAIFISIDDTEQAHLKIICDEIFGRDNFIAETIVQSNSAKNNANFISVTHEYLTIYAKNINVTPKNWRVKKFNADEFKKRCMRMIKSGLTAEEIHKELLILTKYPRFFEFDHYTYADKKGPFRASDLTAPNSKNFYDVIHPVTKLPCRFGGRGWAYSKNEMNKLIADGKILFGEDETVMPQMKNYLFDDDTSLAKSVLFFDTQATTKWIKSNGFNFNFPKPIELIEYILQMYPNKNSIVLDAFAGSGTTAHAVINLNKADGGNRKFILIEEKDYCQTITAERVKRIGGGYKFCRLGERLKVGGLINPAFTFEQLAAYVWFAATNTPSRADYDSPLLGIHEGKAIYYLHNETLTRRTFKELPAYDGEKIIYAAARRIGENFLKENRITFHSTREID